MANSTLTLISSLTMIALFTVAIIGFSIGFANDNDAAVRIDDDSDINALYADSQGNINSLKDNTEDTYSSIVNTTIEAGSDVIKSPAVFTLTWGNLYSTLGAMLTVITVVIFGGNPALAMFTTAFMTLLGIMFALYLIKAWRGNP